MKYLWTKWRFSRPPQNQDIIGSWDDPPEKEGAMHRQGKICKRGGCCFIWENETLIPPIWWRLANQAEADK